MFLKVNNILQNREIGLNNISAILLTKIETETTHSKKAFGKWHRGNSILLVISAIFFFTIL